MYDYYRIEFEARERIQQRIRDAEAERIIRRDRPREQRRRRPYLAAALQLLIAPRRRARANA